MREVHIDVISEAVKTLCQEANFDLGDDVLAALRRAKDTEESPTGRDILEQILQNAEIARTERVPLCQDTGFAVLFVDLGQDVHVVGGDLNQALFRGVAEGYGEGYLRKSIVWDPAIDRTNTKDNTPPVIHTRIVPGEKIHIVVAPKGGGSENMSEVRMMKPADGLEGIKDFVVDRVKRSGGNPCPPIVVGVGIGGTFEQCALLSKKALLRPLGEPNPDPRFAAAEAELLERINALGIGPMGLGGRTTALAVHIEVFPCHIASMPASVNINCHSARHKEVEI
ncbi:fumarate hydratase [candidate division TA06 bacterium DG_24]|jgi:fumarate hydratase subunit alpha|uniref:Fumarate hydratase n=3 Tax=Bacteria division TA06 TaxID=1156500 RepID=A0A0S8JH43_UNCT6|nr:MAG: fumarate hydratase [candidate division TA06 bacterium DG_24]KPK68024.1 MAG: fumarate hydratase [candidate division TA06 bacterium SM23_40]KPL09126.1 MAG: fumarate hydratase [candidate division TA06 bacterium SM1_40]